MLLQVLIAIIAGWINRHQQQVITYLKEENRALQSNLPGGRLRLSDTARRRLAALAHPLSRKQLQDIATSATPDTLMRWDKRLIANKFDGSQQRTEPGRPRVPQEVEQLVMRMVQENPPWSYRRIQGALANLGHHIDTITVRNILRRHHIDPTPQRRQAGMRWAKFLKMHWEVLAATDFFTIEVATWHGLGTYDVLVVIERSTRQGHLAGISPTPHDAFMMQCARQLTDPFDGFLLDKRYLMHDRDTTFTAAFDHLVRASGVEPVILPPRSPNLHAHGERFVRAIKEEALGQMVVMGETSLHDVLHQYLNHNHMERNHQGLDNHLIAPGVEVGRQRGQVVCRERLGGLLSYYYREAA